jgi:hypothetical protein
MKTTTPKKINQRDRIVDSMAKKFANKGSVEHIIHTARKRRFNPMKYVYIFIGMSALSPLLTILIMTGKIAPGLFRPESTVTAEKVPTSVDLMRNDFSVRKIGADQFALYLKDYLIRYDSLPAHYKTTASATSSDTYRELYAIWEQVTLRTRSHLIGILPHLETTWETLGLNRYQGTLNETGQQQSF